MVNAMALAAKTLSVNLRSDLAQMSDAELAKHLEDNWKIVEQERKLWWDSRWLPLFHSFRGPIKHPHAYRFFVALLETGEIGWLGILFAVVFSSKKTERLLRADPVTDTHLSLCEIRDIIEEVERRVEQRKGKAS